MHIKHFYTHREEGYYRFVSTKNVCNRQKEVW